MDGAGDGGSHAPGLGGPMRQQSQSACSPHTAACLPRSAFHRYVPPSCLASPPASQPARVSFPAMGQGTQHVTLLAPSCAEAGSRCAAQQTAAAAKARCLAIVDAFLSRVAVRVATRTTTPQCTAAGRSMQRGGLHLARTPALQQTDEDRRARIDEGAGAGGILREPGVLSAFRPSGGGSVRQIGLWLPQTCLARGASSGVRRARSSLPLAPALPGGNAVIGQHRSRRLSQRM
jgi:hypothetical protein